MRGVRLAPRRRARHAPPPLAPILCVQALALPAEAAAKFAKERSEVAATAGRVCVPAPPRAPPRAPVRTPPPPLPAAPPPVCPAQDVPPGQPARRAGV
jgi:hypothetical protein